MELMDAELAKLLDSIGPRLRALRHDRGLTLETLAKDTGVSVSTLSRLESGLRRPTLDLLIPLARAHRVALDQLVTAPATGDRSCAKPSSPLMAADGASVVNGV